MAAPAVGGYGRGGGGRGRGRGHGDGAGSSSGKGNCHRCGKPGHWACDYRSKQPKKDKEEQAFTTQEEESALLFTEIQYVAPSQPHKSGSGRRISSEHEALIRGDHKGAGAGGVDLGSTGARILEQGERLHLCRCRAPSARPVGRRRRFTSWKKRCMQSSEKKRTRSLVGECWTPAP
jgi:hypothetical protein